MTVLQTAGLSHSEITGSKVICTYPMLIAAYHVLHRLREPRHPPCALIYFLFTKISNHHHTQWKMIYVAHTFSCIVKSSSICDLSKKDGPELQFYFTVFACVNKSKNVSTSNCQKAKTDGCVEDEGLEPPERALNPVSV